MVNMCLVLNSLNSLLLDNQGSLWPFCCGHGIAERAFLSLLTSRDIATVVFRGSLSDRLNLEIKLHKLSDTSNIMKSDMQVSEA